MQKIFVTGYRYIAYCLLAIGYYILFSGCNSTYTSKKKGIIK